MERNWREAKPKWVVDAAETEMSAMRRRLALRWPDESRPTPMEFWWGEYDRLTGEPVAGEYFYHSFDGHVYRLLIRQAAAGWKRWEFSGKGDHWHTSVTRGPLYAAEREAKIAALWAACDRAAGELEKLWGNVLSDRGFV